MKNGAGPFARHAPRRSPILPPLRAERLLDQVRERVRYLHYSLRTEEAYVHWIRAFVRFHACRRHPREFSRSTRATRCTAR